ncbi:unnamed protein product [Hymenolepis diminuta]|uniref:Uncharacterized protein n=1 Tax=Hymenolepis diminuta TaxID=6216 RepID=A0A564YQ98_HYMDI|nr:unnamed protein product [Hymenolepis diminuta]
MSASPSTSTCRPNGELKEVEDSGPDKTQLDAILKKLDGIDSKITDLNDRHTESRRLLNKLRQMEANFRLLFHASRSEIAKLKCQIHKDPSHSTTNRHGNPPKVDPLQPISDSEIISLLHCPSDISFIQSEISIPYSKRIATTTSSQSSSTISSSSSESSSLSSSSSNSSPLSSDSSLHQSPEQNYHSPENLSQNHSNNQTSAIPVDKPVESRPSKKRENAGMKNASTELANGTEGHLMRLFSASIRNARDHHAFSVMNAPPSRGHILDGKEKVEMDKYYDNMEAEKVKSCPPYPDGEEGDQYHHNEKMDIEEITEEESAGGNFDEPRNIQRNESPHIDVEEHVSDIDSQ